MFEINRIAVKTNTMGSEQYPTPTKQPFYSVSNKSKRRDTYHIEVPYWKKSLEQCSHKLHG